MVISFPCLIAPPLVPSQLTITMTMTGRSYKRAKRKAALQFWEAPHPFPEKTWLCFLLLLISSSFISETPNSSLVETLICESWLPSHFHGHQIKPTLLDTSGFVYWFCDTKQVSPNFWGTSFVGNSILQKVLQYLSTSFIL